MSCLSPDKEIAYGDEEMSSFISIEAANEREAKPDKAPAHAFVKKQIKFWLYNK